MPAKWSSNFCVQITTAFCDTGHSLFQKDTGLLTAISPRVQKIGSLTFS
jgi:hypothetical protein